MAKSRSASHSRRTFLQTTTIVAGGLTVGAARTGAASTAPRETSSASALAELPVGSAPSALSFFHFPDRLQAFVWRNWPLVPANRMARVVGAQTRDIERMGGAMCLGKPPTISADQLARSYITIIRRNWHLLPYSQLLELLEWPAEKLAFTLREDDYLFAKLGSLKPACEPLRYRPPDETTLAREAEIARIVQEEFPDGAWGAGEPLFAFVPRLSRPPSGKASPRSSNQLRFCYSYFALYGDPLLEPAADPYPDGYLERLARAGVNGVWLQAVLYQLASFPWDPVRSADSKVRLKNLRVLAARAARHGIRIFLYLNEPRALPAKFFAANPQLKGVAEGDHATLCTSVPEVQNYIVDSVATVARAVPDLGGFFSITASENLTNCWSHGQGAACSRCRARSAPEVIAEVNRLFLKGIRRAGSNAQLIAWDWGWDDDWAAEAIGQLPDGISLMSVSEWRLPINRGGVSTEVGEYSISAVGPGPRATRHWQLARARGLKTVAKIQAGNTWELSAIPWIPAVENVARHASNLREAGVTGVMLGWTLGGHPSANLEVVSEALAVQSPKAAMQRVAERRFGETLAPAIVVAWEKFSAAFSEFPFHIGVVYSGPQQVGPANLLWARPTGYHASMVGFPYDDLDAWRSVYPDAVFVQQLNRVTDGFSRALAELNLATAIPASAATAAQRQALAEECRFAEAAAIHFRSVANQARFVMARKIAANSPEAPAAKTAMQQVLRDEITLARRLHQLQSADSRIGFEASNQYYYVPIDLVEKVLNARHLLKTMEKS